MTEKRPELKWNLKLEDGSEVASDLFSLPATSPSSLIRAVAAPVLVPMVAVVVLVAYHMYRPPA